MSEFGHAIDVFAPADDLFELVSDPSRLQDFLPLTGHAAADDPKHVGLTGTGADGAPFDTAGFMHVDQHARRMEWGADGIGRYRGKLEVKDAGLGHATLRVALDFDDDGDGDEATVTQPSDPADRRLRLQQSLEQALQRIKALLEDGEHRLLPLSAPTLGTATGVGARGVAQRSASTSSRPGP